MKGIHVKLLHIWSLGALLENNIGRVTIYLFVRGYILKGTIGGNAVKDTSAEAYKLHILVSGQRGIAASKGNQILWLIMRNITYKEKQLIVPLYKASNS